MSLIIAEALARAIVGVPKGGKLPVLFQAKGSRKRGGGTLYPPSDKHGIFAIYFLNPCFRVLLT